MAAAEPANISREEQNVAAKLAIMHRCNRVQLVLFAFDTGAKVAYFSWKLPQLFNRARVFAPQGVENLKRENRKLVTLLLVVSVLIPPTLCAVLIVVATDWLDTNRDAFNLPLFLVCLIVVLLGLSLMAIHFSWVSPCVVTIENWVDNAAALTILLGGCWMALGVVFSKKQAKDLSESKEEPWASVFILASIYAKQGIVLVAMGSGIIFAKPFIVRFEKMHASPNKRPCVQEGAEQLMRKPALVARSHAWAT